jgi:glucose/mannose-6-phosphate isomerase
MLEHYLEWYRYTLEAFDYPVYNVRDFSDTEKVIVAGMGGSGIVGDMLATIASDLGNIAVHVFKDFYLPKKLVDSKTFVLSISYSGNTLETISSTAVALEFGAKVGVVASGGRLLDIAKTRRLPYTTVRSGLVPRLALPMMLVAAIKLLSNCSVNVIPLQTLRSSVEILSKINEASSVAREIANVVLQSSIPTIVATTRYQALALRFKNELNENSKIPVKVEIIPELFHNDIVGWEASKLKDVVVLIDSDIDYENILVNFYEDYLRSLSIKTYILKLIGNIIERSLYGSLIAGIASVYIAQRRGLDPLTTKSIAMYKNVLKNLETEVFKYYNVST